MAWSPDGKWLAFGGNLQSKGLGVRLVKVDTGEVIWAAKGDYGVSSWSPDGKRILVNGPPPGKDRIGTEDSSSALYILDVSSVVGK
ncbi:MAG: PD40 domain-containing protein [Chloroflexi bacterium]|nr:PD40 domain-containing protein [Chloroflexota bacterium]